MYAVLEIPAFSLQAVLRQMQKPLAGPSAVMDEDGANLRVISLNTAAARMGIELGMRPAQALARCGHLQFFSRCQRAEAMSGRLLALLAQELSPRVEWTRPGLVTLDLKGLRAERLEATIQALIKRFKCLGLRVRVGIATTPDHALWAAYRARPLLWVQNTEAFIEALPIAVADLSDSLTAVFKSWNIGKLGALRRLPREALGRRLGLAGLKLWDRVAGRECRMLRCHESAPCFEREQMLDFRVERMEDLLFILNRFVEELSLELARAHAAAFLLKLRLNLDDRSQLSPIIEVPEPSGRASTLFRLLEMGLESLKTESAIVGVSLRMETVEQQERQGDLFTLAMEARSHFAETADRIAALVGPGRSGSPRLSDTWKPDAFYLEIPDASMVAETSTFDTAGLGGMAYARLRPPRMVRVLLRDGFPQALAGPEFIGNILDRVGPWRVSGNWWEPEAWSREEWDVALQAGGLYRLFREKAGWFVEGIYG